MGASVFPYYLVCCPTGIACCAVTSVSSSLRRPLGGRCVSISLLLGVLSYRYCLLCCDERQFFIEKAIGWALRQYFHWVYYLVCCPTGIACCAVTSVSSSLRRPLGGRCASISLLLGVLSYRYCLLCCDERQFFIAIGWALRQYFLTTLVVLQVFCCAVTSVSSSLRRPLGGRCVSISLLLGVLSYRYCLLCCDERQFFIEKAIGWALRQYFLTTWCVVLQVLPAVL